MSAETRDLISLAADIAQVLSVAGAALVLTGHFLARTLPRVPTRVFLRVRVIVASLRTLLESDVTTLGLGGTILKKTQLAF